MRTITVFCWAIIAIAIMAPTSFADKGADSAKYKAALDQWAGEVKGAREEALKTYVNLNFSNLKTGVSTREEDLEGKVTTSTVHIRGNLTNNSDFPIKYSSISIATKDSKGRTVHHFRLRSSGEIFPGEKKDLNMTVALRGLTSSPKTAALASGECVGQINLYELKAQKGELWGAITSSGKPFAPTPPRAPYWYTDQQIKEAKGEAETRHGIYDTPEPLPQRPWFAIYGESGQFTGTIPEKSPSQATNTYGEDETAVSKAEIRPITENGQEVESEEAGTMGTVSDGAKATMKTVDAVTDLVKSLNDLFN